MSLVALSTDIMLPALSVIGDELGAGHENEAQLVVSALFLGLALGQMVYGPLSDRYGRKPLIQAGLLLFMAGSLLIIFAPSMPVMLAGRMLQGMGVAGPRIVSTAMVRDCYGGGAMARMMSLVMTIFMLVPIIAPALGQVLLMLGHWRLIFAVLLVIALIGATWLHFGQAETLPLDRRRPLSLRSLRDAAMETVRHPVARGYIVAAGLMFGAFLGYIATSPQIFQEQYGLGELFPLVFACLALFFGSASLINSRLVMRLGMQRLAGGGLIGLSGSAILFLPIALQTGGHPPLWAFMAYLALTFFSFGVLFGNFNALAMEPLGHIAGMAAGVIGTSITFMAMLLGGVIGSFYDRSVTPVVAGFAVLGSLSLVAMLLAERGRRALVSKPGAAKTSP